LNPFLILVVIFFNYTTHIYEWQHYIYVLVNPNENLAFHKNDKNKKTSSGPNKKIFRLVALFVYMAILLFNRVALAGAGARRGKGQRQQESEKKGFLSWGLGGVVRTQYTVIKALLRL
jgi:hypothetical protein